MYDTGGRSIEEIIRSIIGYIQLEMHNQVFDDLIPLIDAYCGDKKDVPVAEIKELIVAYQNRDPAKLTEILMINEKNWNTKYDTEATKVLTKLLFFG